MNEKPSVFNLKCLNCGANLKLTNNISEFACRYCGASQMILRQDGIVTLELISGKIDRIQRSIGINSAELKIQRLNS